MPRCGLERQGYLCCGYVNEASKCKDGEQGFVVVAVTNEHRRQRGRGVFICVGSGRRWLAACSSSQADDLL
jgi:hypothetical protein